MYNLTSLIICLILSLNGMVPSHSGHALFEFSSKRGKLVLDVRVDMADLNEAVVLKGGCGIFQTKTVCADRYIQDRLYCTVNGQAIKLELDKFKKKEKHALLFYKSEVITEEIKEFALTLECFLDVNPLFVNTVSIDLEELNDRKSLDKDDSSLLLFRED